MRTRRAILLATATAAAVIGSVLVAVHDGGVNTSAAAQQPAQSRAPKKPDRLFTLITGDRVVLRGGDPHQASVSPGPGRTGIRFRQLDTGRRVTIIPSDAEPLIVAGRLDERLFDLTRLASDDLDDSQTTDLPLLVQYASRQPRALAGTTISRTLPRFGGAAVRLPKQNAGGFLSRLDGVRKVWLNARLRPVLDRSTKQIGVPAARRAGLTGRGITVAVVDTGVDANHPDLRGRVAAARDFTGSGAGDEVGHGTHVASTIGGTGAASGGRYRGVAPEARLLDAKVCAGEGCAEDAILAGIEWAAVEQRAKVVNLSLGGPDTEGPDPLEDAVNALTAKTGALFVISAGNDGPHPGTVGSPGNAHAALTVGAVDRAGRIAEFSSRGPRLQDGAIKPDVTAPGAGIVAARAAKGYIGVAIGRHYAAMDGTSMAAPHVAGSVALLAQQHRNWTGQRLKAALVATARPQPKQTVSDQGAGLIDLANATKGSVQTEGTGLWFGVARWPHPDDKPQAKPVTYRNTGDKPVVLKLRAQLRTADGNSAHPDALKLTTSQLTVPAGGSASVTITSDTRHAGPDGRYDGHLVATSNDGVRLVTPLAVDKEVESYDVTVRHLGPDGAPADSYWTALIGLDVVAGGRLVPGTTVSRLPKGAYVLDSIVATTGEDWKNYILVQPRLVVDKDLILTIDARQAKPVTTTLPRDDLSPVGFEYGHRTPTTNGVLVGAGGASSGALDRTFFGQLGSGNEKLTSYVASTWAQVDSNGSGRNTSVSYNLVQRLPGRFPTGYSRVVTDGELATVTSRQSATGERLGAKYLGWEHPDLGFAFLTMGHELGLPRTIEHHVEADAIRWYGTFEELVPDPEDPDALVPVSRHTSGHGSTYRAGEQTTERWNAAVFGPGLAGFGWAERQGDRIVVAYPPAVDGDGRPGSFRFDQMRATLYRNGKPVASMPRPDGLAVGQLPAARSAYRLVVGTSYSSRPGLSTETTTSWTFRSQASRRAVKLPLRTVQFRPPVDDRNSAARDHALPFTLTSQPGTELPAPARVELEVSADARTWQPAKVVHQSATTYKASVPKLTGPRISLRATVTDRSGDQYQITVQDAYYLRDR